MKSKHSSSSLIIALIAAVLAAALLAGCGADKAADTRLREDLESMRYVELDQDVENELYSILSDQGKEYFEMFLSKAGEFDYEITDSKEGGADSDGQNSSGKAVTISVRVRTYDFGSEYLKTWSEFLEEADALKEADKASGKSEGGEDASPTDLSSYYDPARLYETLFLNLSSLGDKNYVADVDVTCTQAEDGSWQTDAASNIPLRNAILGGLINEISSLADLED